jgi:inner membrane protein YhjD
MPDVKGLLGRVDALQQRYPVTAFPAAVMKKFSKDQGGHLAALLTYYGFLSLFPLLLVFVTVLGFLLHDNPKLQQDLIDSAVGDFPVIGDQLKSNVDALTGDGFALFVGIAVALYGGLGVANAAQHAMNRLWDVPDKARPGFFPRLARSVVVIAILAGAIVVTTALGRMARALGDFGIAARAGLIVSSVAASIGLFLLAFHVLTAREVGWRALVPGAIVAAIGWQALQAIGEWFVSRQLRGMSQSYGVFALVLGLLAWIYLVAQVVLISAEINVVKERSLWPRPFFDNQNESEPETQSVSE